jgi:hypothetical protein
MNIFDFFKKKKTSAKQEQQTIEVNSLSSNSTSLNLFTKKEMEYFISILTNISYLFYNSKLLQGGRNKTMKDRIASYIGILSYYYVDEYHYGNIKTLVDQDVLFRYALIRNLMTDTNHKKNVITELSDNWSDVLQVIFNMQLEPNIEGNKFKEIESEIEMITFAFEKISGKKCKEPIDPRKITPKKVTYNPLNITEDLALSQGHIIPDITNVFAQELIPLLTSPYSTKERKDIVAEYTIAMIKSYYENAGFVPMVIVDQITGQINQVTEKIQRISYSPYSSLKEYVLSKIYK